MGEVADPTPPGTRTAVFVGWQFSDVEADFARCEVVARLDNGVDAPNDEGRPGPAVP